MADRRIQPDSSTRVVWSSQLHGQFSSPPGHVLYAKYLRGSTDWRYQFLLDSPINTPPPVTWREWLSWKFGRDFDQTSGRYFPDAREFRKTNQITDDALGLVVDSELWETGRVNSWSLTHSPQAKANRYLRVISDKFGPMKDHNHPNPRLEGIILQTFPSCLNGWLAAYATSIEAVKNLSAALAEIKEPTRVEVLQ